MENIIIPNSVTSIGASIFNECFNLSSVTLSDNITEIKRNSFNNCPKLTNIVIPSGVTKIGDIAFNPCISLTSVTVNAIEPPVLGESVFDNSVIVEIRVPSNSVVKYKQDNKWGIYGDKIKEIE